MSSIEVTVFDLDRTITVRGTYSPFLLFAARSRAPWRLLLVPVVIGLMGGYRIGLVSRKQLKELMHQLMVGRQIPADEMRALAEAYADHTLHGNVRNEMRQIVAREQSDGRLLILATAAHRFYAEPIARRLGIDEVVATESLQNAKTICHLIDGENCFGKAKASAVAARLTKLGLERNRVKLRCYSDDYSDLPLLTASDEPVAVHPSAKLQRHAKAQGWSVIECRPATACP